MRVVFILVAMIIHFNFARMVFLRRGKEIMLFEIQQFHVDCLCNALCLHFVLFIAARAFVWCRCADTFPFVV